MEQEKVLEHLKKVFKYSTSQKVNKSTLIFPKPIFVNEGFKNFVCNGGNIAEDEEEYQKIMSVLKTIGEDKYYVVVESYPFNENKFEFQTVSTNSTYADFKRAIEKINHNMAGFDIIMDDLFVFGETDEWGIYMSDWIYMNIYGSAKEYIKLFADANNASKDEFINRKQNISMNFSLANKKLFYTDGELMNIFEANYINNVNNYFNQ